MLESQKKKYLFSHFVPTERARAAVRTQRHKWDPQPYAAECRPLAGEPPRTPDLPPELPRSKQWERVEKYSRGRPVLSQINGEDYSIFTC